MMKESPADPSHTRAVIDPRQESSNDGQNCNNMTTQKLSPPMTEKTTKPRVFKRGTGTGPVSLSRVSRSHQFSYDDVFHLQLAPLRRRTVLGWPPARRDQACPCTRKTDSRTPGRRGKKGQGQETKTERDASSGGGGGHL